MIKIRNVVIIVGNWNHTEDDCRTRDFPHSHDLHVQQSYQKGQSELFDLLQNGTKVKLNGVSLLWIPRRALGARLYLKILVNVVFRVLFSDAAPSSPLVRACRNY
jgi:hypothetical protein